MLGFSAIGELALGEGPALTGFNLSVTQADDTVSSAAVSSIAVNAALAPAGDSLAATGAVALLANLAATAGADTVAATAGILAALNFAAAEDDNTVSGAAAALIEPDLDIIQDDDSLSASGSSKALNALLFEEDMTVSATVVTDIDVYAAISVPHFTTGALAEIGAAGDLVPHDSAGELAIHP
jgi:hypothetical protein